MAERLTLVDLAVQLDVIGEELAVLARDAQEALIQARALHEQCDTCNSRPGKRCITRNGRATRMFHRPRIVAATATADATHTSDGSE
ncbi:hypothetical protein AB0C10_21535 [Microbispora amethystogenes]|uniref:zinc finger domain-containing protein n=1 Tax=Microbispora amethystogenes TaxID=1427754 RepID=UPI0033F60F3F